MPHDFGDSARALLQERKKLQDQFIVTPEVWVREMHLEPSTPYFRSNNFIQNTLARLVGWYPLAKDWRRLIIDAQGRLEVSTIQASYDTEDVYFGNAADAYGATVTFDDVAKRVDVFVWDNAMWIRRNAAGVGFNDPIEVPANSVYSFDGTTHSFAVKNKTAGLVARYQIVGWW